MPIWRCGSIERCLAVTAICGVTCLAVSASPLRADNAADGIYIGKRLGKNASCQPVEDNVSVVVRGHVLEFTNDRLINKQIQFNLKPDGSFNQVHVDIGGSVVSIKGQITEGVLDAQVDDNTCKYQWHLTKKQ